MLKKGLFKKPNNRLEGAEHGAAAQPNAPEKILCSCPACKAVFLQEELEENLQVCKKCGHHRRLGARSRIAMVTDPESFSELFGELSSVNILDFPEYDDKLAKAKKESGEKEGVLCGTAALGGEPCAVFAMEPDFMMGSMGTVVGEKITRLFEYALAHSLPVVGFTVSGGARMQEGILSLMQMAKVSGAVKLHSDQGLLYITVLTHPTTGGVTASFAMEGDVLLAEPGALIGFAGPRVIEQTIRQKLPSGFQKAEFLLEKGFVDAIVPRTEQRAYLIKLLQMHRREAAV